MFGSVPWDEETKESDVDLLVGFKEGRSLLDKVGLMQELEDLLGCRVDVVTDAWLHWDNRDKVRKEARVL